MAITDYTIDYNDNGSPSAYSNAGETSDIVTTASGFQDAQLSFSLGNTNYQTDVPGFYSTIKDSNNISTAVDWTSRLRNVSDDNENPITALDYLTNKSYAKTYEDYYNKTTAEFEDAYKQTGDYYNAYIQALSNSVGTIAAPQIAAEKAEYNQNSYDLLNRAYATGMVGLGSAQQQLKNIFNESVDEIMASAQSQVGSAVNSAYTQRDKALSSVQKQYDEFADTLSKEWKSLVDSGAANVKEFSNNIASLLEAVFGKDWISDDTLYDPRSASLTDDFWGKFYDFVIKVTSTGTDSYTAEELDSIRNTMFQDNHDVWSFFFENDVNRSILLDAMGVDDFKNTGIDWDSYDKVIKDYQTMDNETFGKTAGSILSNVDLKPLTGLNLDNGLNENQINMSSSGGVLSDYVEKSKDGYKLRVSAIKDEDGNYKLDVLKKLRADVMAKKTNLGSKYDSIIAAINTEEKTALSTTVSSGIVYASGTVTLDFAISGTGFKDDDTTFTTHANKGHTIKYDDLSGDIKKKYDTMNNGQIVKYDGTWYLVDKDNNWADGKALLEININYDSDRVARLGELYNNTYFDLG